MFDGRNFEFYHEELTLWMQKNFRIEWTLITNDVKRNKAKPADNPHHEYDDQQHAWDAIFNGCKNVQDLASILQLSVRGTKHMEFATLAWKHIVEHYSPKTPASKHHKLLQFEAASASFDGDIFKYEMKIKAALAELGQHAPANDKIKKKILDGILNSPASGERSDITSWHCFVINEKKNNEDNLDVLFKRAKCHCKFQQQTGIWEEDCEKDYNKKQEQTTTDQAGPVTQDTGSKDPSIKTTYDKRGREHNDQDEQEKHDAHGEDGADNIPSARRKLRRFRPPKRVLLQQRAAAELAKAQGSPSLHPAQSKAPFINACADLPVADIAHSTEHANSPLQLLLSRSTCF